MCCFIFLVRCDALLRGDCVFAVSCSVQRALVWGCVSQLRRHRPGAEVGICCVGCNAPQLAMQVYTFQTSTTAGGDEGVRLWVDGQLLIDAWATSRSLAVLFIGASMFLLLFRVYVHSFLNSIAVYSNTVVFPVANAL